MTIKRRSRNVSEPSSTPAKKNGFSLISDKKLIQLYASMFKCRMLEERMRLHYGQSRPRKTDGTASCQEAALVGTAIDLLKEDTVHASNLDFLVYFIKGIPLDQLFGQPIARFASRDKGRSSRLSTCLKLATKAALAHQADKKGQIALAFAGEESVLHPCWQEELHFAGTNRLPMLFVCQEKQSADPISLKQENKDGDLAQEVQSCGFPRITVDANDVVAVYRVASEAIAHARKGNGPTLIVCKTYRLNEHSTAGSRKQAATLQMESPEDHDPILNMEKYLAGKGLFRKQLKASIAADFCEDLYGAFELVTKSQAAETSP